MPSPPQPEPVAATLTASERERLPALLEATADRFNTTERAVAVLLSAGFDAGQFADAFGMTRREAAELVDAVRDRVRAAVRRDDHAAMLSEELGYARPRVAAIFPPVEAGPHA